MNNNTNVLPFKNKQPLPENMVDFVKAYIESLLKHTTEDGGNSGLDGEELTLHQHGYSEEDFDEMFQLKIADDCMTFLTTAYEFVDLAVTTEEFSYDYHLAGWDFWLCRRRHGDAFWCRGLDVLGKRLTEIGESFLPPDIYLSDQGKICCS